MGQDEAPRNYCDAYGTYKDIKKYSVTIEEVALDYEPGAIPENVSVWTPDLSPRGLARLKNFIYRGTSAASREAKEEIEQAEVNPPEPEPEPSKK